MVGTAVNNQTNASSSYVNQSEVSNSTNENVESTIPGSGVDDESSLSKSGTNTSKGSTPVVPPDSIVKNETSQDDSIDRSTTENKSNASRSATVFSPSSSITNNKPDTSLADPENVTKHDVETSEGKPTLPRSESDSDTIDALVENKNNSQNPQTKPKPDSVTEKPSSVTEDKTITNVKSPNSDNPPEKQSSSADSIKRDRALFFKYLNSNNDNVKEEDKPEVNNRPVAINDKAVTDANIPVSINILRNDKDSDGDKLSIMGLSPPIKGKIDSDSNGMITYSPSESWSGTERFGYTVSDGRGGVATGSVTVIVQPGSVENQPPESQDQDVTVNANSPVKIKLGAKDPDDGKLRFVLVSKPSHGRIVQFSSSTGTLAYIPDQNYDGKDDFAFKVHDGTVFSKDAKVSIKIEMNEKLSRDQVQQDDKQQPNRQQSSQTPTDEEKPADDKSNNNDTPPSDSSDQSSSPTQDAEQQKSDVKEEQQPSDSEKSTSDADTASSGDSQLNS